MENVELSNDEVESLKREQDTEEVIAPSRKRIANIVSQQTPGDFEVSSKINFDDTDPEQGKSEKKVDKKESVKAEKSGDEELLAQGDGEGEEEGESDSDPKLYLPEYLSEMISEQFPDAEITSEDQAKDLMSRIIDDSKALEAERQANDKLYDLFEKSEEMTQVARAMNEGRSFLEAVALSVNIDEALTDLKESDPAEYKKVIKAQVEREQKLEEQEKVTEQREVAFVENSQKSRKNIDSFKESKNLDEKSSQEFLSTLNQHFDNMVEGKITPKYLSIVHNGMNYDKDVAAAKEQGIIEGRNQKIDAEKVKKKGDSIPRFSGGGSRTVDTGEDVSRGKRALALIATNNQSKF